VTYIIFLVFFRCWIY